MGRLTLNVLLSFAQFEREVIGERVRDKIAASKRKGLWVGGPIPLGYATVNKKLVRGGGIMDGSSHYSMTAPLRRGIFSFGGSGLHDPAIKNENPKRPRRHNQRDRDKLLWGSLV
jgi:hypothetical protein